MIKKIYNNNLVKMQYSELYLESTICFTWSYLI